MRAIIICITAVYLKVVASIVNNLILKGGVCIFIFKEI